MFLRDRLSYLHLFVILKFFSRFSGLRLNDDKTELFAIGPQNLVQEEFYHKTCTSIKILGIYFDYHKTTRRNSNFNSISVSSPLTKHLICGNGEVSHFLAEFKLLKRLLSQISV